MMCADPMTAVALDTPEEHPSSSRRSGTVRRGARKHRLALVTLGLYLLFFFFPSLFMGRVVSPNDVYRHYEPWSAGEDFVAQNPTMHDPPMAYFPIAVMMRRAPESFHWNPWLASGIPGWGSAASAVLSPFVLVPAALLPLSLFYTGIIALKILVAFWCGYLWLREERLGKGGAAVGALVVSASGPMFALWLWQSTNATALYPALLLAIARMFHGKKNSLPLLVLVGVAMLLSGYPASILMGLWLALAYTAFLMVRRRIVPWREMGRAAAAIVISLAITAPFLSPFVSFVRETGYLEMRETISRRALSPTHLVGLVDADFLGNPARHLWRGDPALGPLNNYIELTIWVGGVVLLLALVGFLSRRSRAHSVFWLAFAAFLLLVVAGVVRWDWLLDLPGLRYSPATRLRVLLPPAFAFLAAAGFGVLLKRNPLPWRWKPLVPFTVIVFLALSYARTAAELYPYLTPGETRVATETSPAIEFLQEAEGVFRVAPTFYWLMPNSAQSYGIEDVRSQWSSEGLYRTMLGRIDPSSASSRGTLLLLNGLTMDVEDPLLRLLNVRYVIEPAAIDILRWRIAERVERNGTAAGGVAVVRPGAPLIVPVSIGESPPVAIDLHAYVQRSWRRNAHLLVELRDTGSGETLARTARSRDQLASEARFFVTTTGIEPGRSLELRLSAEGMGVEVPLTGEGEVLMGRSTSRLVYVDELPGSRIYEIAGTLPRYRATWEIETAPIEEVLAVKEFDYAERTVLGDASASLISQLALVPAGERVAKVELVAHGPSRQVVETKSRVPFLLTASEKISPDLRVRVDGRVVEPLRANGLFFAVPLEAGSHRVEIERRLGRGWWPISVAGLLALLAGVFVERRGRIGSAGTLAGGAEAPLPPPEGSPGTQRSP
jgi:hypothetical protein